MALPELEGFEFVRVIGRGGTATVYLATQAPFGRSVAIKVYQGSITEVEARRVFDKECRAIGQLSSHQGFAAFHAAGFMEDGSPYLVMKYYPNGSLAARVKSEGPLGVDEVIAVGARIGGALAASHASGIFHRDVKPENMLLDDEGSAVLADFGISAIVDGSSSRSMLAFSPSHVAPEVLNGDRAGAPADLYSFASSLYALLEGKAPFELTGDVHPSALLVRVMQQDPPPITRSDVPPQLRALIMRTLAKSPTERPADMEAFLHDLSQIGTEAAGSSIERSRTQRSDPLGVVTEAPSSEVIDDRTVLRPIPDRTAVLPNEDGDGRSTVVGGAPSASMSPSSDELPDNASRAASTAHIPGDPQIEITDSSTPDHAAPGPAAAAAARRSGVRRPWALLVAVGSLVAIGALLLAIHLGSKGSTPVSLSTAVTNTIDSGNYNEVLQRSTAPALTATLAFQTPDKLGGFFDRGKQRFYDYFLGAYEYQSQAVTPTTPTSKLVFYKQVNTEPAEQMDFVATFLPIYKQKPADKIVQNGNVFSFTLVYSGLTENFTYTVDGKYVTKFQRTLTGTAESSETIQLTISDFGTAAPPALPKDATIKPLPASG